MNPTQDTSTTHRPLRAVDIIIKKRDGLSLSREEIDYFIKGYTAGEIPDYQASALCMAILLRDMTDQETTDLNPGYGAFRGSIGSLPRLSVMPWINTPLVVWVIKPLWWWNLLVAACGLKVAKMSGRGSGI